MRVSLEQVNYIYQPGSITAAQALHQVNLSVESGQLVAVIGHGGSGKSTLALLLAGLYRPTSGQVRLSGVTEQEPSFRQVGLVFQYPEQQLFGETVFEEVAFGAKNRGLAGEELTRRVEQALAAVDLEAAAFRERSPFSLSGGQKRRVCIASVLVLDPELIILDEPTAGLDEAGRAWMLGLVRQWQAQGRAVVWITHNMAEAAEIAQRVVVLSQGRILLEGTPQQVFAAEDVLRQAHLEAPPAARLVRQMQARGWTIPAEAVTAEAACRELGGYLAAQAPKGRGGGHV